MKKILLITLLSACTLTATATNGIYLGLEGGIAQQSGLPSIEDVGASSMQTHYAPNAIRASAGYNHDLFKCFGIGFEAGLGRYAKTTYDYPDGESTEVASRTLEFLAVGTFHASPKFDLLAKIGGLRQTPITSGRGAPERNAKIATEAALGVAYNITPRVAVTATFSHVFGSQLHTFAELSNSAPSLNEAMIGIRYTFGS